MIDRTKFLLSRLHERLWVKPLFMCLLSVGIAFAVKAVDGGDWGDVVPEISPETIETLLEVMASSMLLIATFAVGSMVSSYANADTTSTPRAFALVVSDDVSQNALSTFVGAFIFSIVALVGVLNDLYEKGGRFALFCVILLVFAIVIGTFVSWVDRIARLGRMGTTIRKVEAATEQAVVTRLSAPRLGGAPITERPDGCLEILGGEVGYVQRVDVPLLQDYAEEAGLRMAVAALPGTFSVPDRPLVYLLEGANKLEDVDCDKVREAFEIGSHRTYVEDPRFGLVVLSEIASRALSPGVNDPGTAIEIIGTVVRLMVRWTQPAPESAEKDTPEDCGRIEVPEVEVKDMIDDAFTALTRDGAGTIEVGIRLQKALRTIAHCGDEAMETAAKQRAQTALQAAEQALTLQTDLDALKDLNQFATV